LVRLFKQIICDYTGEDLNNLEKEILNIFDTSNAFNGSESETEIIDEIENNQDSQTNQIKPALRSDGKARPSRCRSRCRCLRISKTERWLRR